LGTIGINVATELSFKSKNQSETSLSMPPPKEITALIPYRGPSLRGLSLSVYATSHIAD